MFCEILSHVVEESDRVLEDGIVWRLAGVERELLIIRSSTLEVHLETLKLSLIANLRKHSIPHSLSVTWSSSHWFRWAMWAWINMKRIAARIAS